LTYNNLFEFKLIADHPPQTEIKGIQKTNSADKEN